MNTVSEAMTDAGTLANSSRVHLTIEWPPASALYTEDERP